MEPRDEEVLFLLLDDYGRSLGRRASMGGSGRLPASGRPIWLRAGDFRERLLWQRSQGAAQAVVPALAGPPPEFAAARFDPVRRYRQAPGSGIWPPDPETRLRLEVDWGRSRVHSSGAYARVASAVLHLLLAALIMMPRTMELDMTEPADWNAMRITLAVPPLDDLPPLDGPSSVPGEGEEGFRGLPAPAPEPVPEPAGETLPEPEPEAASEVAQPVESEPEEEHESPALAEEQPDEEAETPLAQSPVPGEFRQGAELAQARDPRLLPMPKAPSRKRAVLQLEPPKASMPSRQGAARLGTLELTASPGRAIEGAIHQMVRGGGARQAVGIGVGGISTPGALPSGPSDSGSLVELLSDPRGVDFRPYLTQILAAVRRNWLAVIPESARLGMSRGRTLIQFSVARSGSVPKLVIARSSGTAPLDRAAVAGISASNPFPPLPSEYLGQDIRLQFTFLYNIRNP